MAKQFYVENYSVKTFKTANNKDMFLIKLQDIRGTYNIVIPAAYLQAVLESSRIEDQNAQAITAEAQ